MTATDGVQWPAAETVRETVDRHIRTLEDTLIKLVEVSEIRKRVEDDSELPILGFNLWRWEPLPDSELGLLARARDALKAWLESGEKLIALNAPEFGSDFEKEAPTFAR